MNYLVHGRASKKSRKPSELFLQKGKNSFQNFGKMFSRNFGRYFRELGSLTPPVKRVERGLQCWVDATPLLDVCNRRRTCLKMSPSILFFFSLFPFLYYFSAFSARYVYFRPANFYPPFFFLLLSDCFLHRSISKKTVCKRPHLKSRSLTFRGLAHTLRRHSSFSFFL